MRQETLALIESALDAAGAEGLARTAAAEELTQLVERAAAIEAAELRAALREWREAGRAEAAAHKAWNNAIAAQPPLTKYIDDWQAAKDRLDDAMAALRRLAASEGRGE